MSHEDPTLPSDRRDLLPGPTRIGRFALRRIIASGGMGTVYEAIQDHPRRPVAVKVMKRGITSRTAMRRFEFEAQLLARLHHPGVAEIYEAGTYDDGAGGVPYFAMEYVPNAKPITDFADARNLDVRARLRLFLQVCDAIQHGHQKGIIHRDLKPANIIVGPDGQPKVIDFGVARATDSDLAFATLQTHVGQLVGTLQYMSPEQVSADPHDIDIRSDVYSLGVVLYELLTGRLPYDVTDVSTLEAVRLVREASPRRLGSADRRLSGDVETIVHKALEKDRERRYQTAGELASDIRRHLDCQPITAHPPTVFYTLKVFTKRNRALVGSVAAVFVVLVLGAVTSTAMYLRAEAQRAEAERQAARTLKAVGFVQNMVESANPSCRGEQVMVGDLLDRYGETVDKAFPDDPEIEATIRTSIGRAYSFLDQYEKGGQAENYQAAARSHLKKAIELRRGILGPDDPEVLASILEYVNLLREQSRYGEAESLCREVLAVRRRTLGEKDLRTITGWLNVALVLSEQGRYREAEPIAREVLEQRRQMLGEDDPNTLQAMDFLADVLFRRNDPEGSEKLVRDELAIRTRALGPDDPQTKSARRKLARMLLAAGNIEESRELYGNWKLPVNLGVDRWLQGRADPQSGSLTLFVAYESWCPYSAQAMPRLETLYEKYRAKGLEVIGLTTMSRDYSDEMVHEFLKKHGVAFPIAKVNDEVSPDLYPGGVPYAVLTDGSAMVWQGHPDELPEEFLAGLVAAR